MPPRLYLAPANQLRKGSRLQPLRSSEKSASNRVWIGSRRRGRQSCRLDGGMLQEKSQEDPYIREFNHKRCAIESLLAFPSRRSHLRTAALVSAVQGPSHL